MNLQNLKHFNIGVILTLCYLECVFYVFLYCLNVNLSGLMTWVGEERAHFSVVTQVRSQNRNFLIRLF